MISTTTIPTNDTTGAEIQQPDRAVPTSYEECDALARAIADKHVEALREALKDGRTLSDLCQVRPGRSVEEALADEHHDVFMDKAADFGTWLLHHQAAADLSKVIDELSLFYARHPLWAAARLLIQAAEKRKTTDDNANLTDVLNALFSVYGFAEVREKFAEIEAESKAQIEANAQRPLRPWADPKPRP